MMSDVRTWLVTLEWAIFAFFIFVNTFYLLQLICAAIEIRHYKLLQWQESRWRILGSRIAPRITVLAPAYNEAVNIVATVHSLLALHYPSLEVIVVNDGSTDDTLLMLARKFELVAIHPIYRNRISTKPVRVLYRSRSHPNLIVIDKVNGGGKSDAMNAGLNMANGSLVCTIDADTLIEPDALQRMVRPFLFDDAVVAVGGTIRVANGSTVEAGRVVDPRCPQNPLAGFQTIEYLRAFLFGRLGLNLLGGNLIISGAFGLFRRQAILESGGYSVDSVGEDMELVVRMRRRGYESRKPHRVSFIPDPVAWTQVPERLSVLARQRDRWQRGLSEVLLRHRILLFNPRYGALGLLGYPVYLFVEWLAAPIEMLGLMVLIVGMIIGAIDYPFALFFLAGAYGYGLVLSTVTFFLEETSYHRYRRFSDRLLLLMWALLENFGYRQLTVLWRVQGIVRFFLGRKDWGASERRSFQPADDLTIPKVGVP